MTLEIFLAELGVNGQSEATIRREAEGLPEAVIARTRESLRARRPRPDVPAAYVVSTLRRLRAELEARRLTQETVVRQTPDVPAPASPPLEPRSRGEATESTGAPAGLDLGGEP